MREPGRGLWTMLRGEKGVRDKGCRVSTGLWKSRGALGVVTRRREGLYGGDKPARWWLSCGKNLEVRWIYFLLLITFCYLFLSRD